MAQVDSKNKKLRDIIRAAGGVQEGELTPASRKRILERIKADVEEGKYGTFDTSSPVEEYGPENRPIPTDNNNDSAFRRGNIDPGYTRILRDLAKVEEGKLTPSARTKLLERIRADIVEGKYGTFDTTSPVKQYGPENKPFEIPVDNLDKDSTLGKDKIDPRYVRILRDLDTAIKEGTLPSSKTRLSERFKADVDEGYLPSYRSSSFEPPMQGPENKPFSYPETVEKDGPFGQAEFDPEYTRLLEEQATALEEEGKPEEAEALREEARKEEPSEEEEPEGPGLLDRIKSSPYGRMATEYGRSLASSVEEGVETLGDKMSTLGQIGMGAKPPSTKAPKTLAEGLASPEVQEETPPPSLKEAVSAPVEEEEPTKTKPARKPAKEPALPLQRPYTREEAEAAGEIEKAPTLQERIGLLRTELKQAGEDRDRLRKIADYGELASIIGRSLAQIGAAQAGLKAGIDLSGVAQKSLINWDAKRQEISDDYKQRVSEIQAEQKDIQRQIERTEDKEDRDRLRKEDFENKMKIVRMQMDQKDKNAAAKQLLKSTTAAMKGDKEAIKQQQAAIKAALTDTDKQISTLTNLANQLKFGDKKGKEVSIKQKAAELAGILGVEKVEVSEVFGDDLIDKEDALALLQERLADLTATRDQYTTQFDSLNKMEVELLRGGQAAPSAPAAPVAKRADVQEYADTYLNGDYDRAYEILKRKGQL